MMADIPRGILAATIEEGIVTEHPAENERLTEAEWEHRRANRECDRHGHSWRIMHTLAGPYALVCERACDDPGYAIRRQAKLDVSE